MNMYSVLDFICILCGAYLAYTGTVMKTQGKIISNVVLGKGATEASIRDKEGFIQYLHGKLIGVGAIIIVAGAVNLVSDYRGGNAIISFVSCAVFAGAIVVYGIFTNKAMKKFVI